MKVRVGGLVEINGLSVAISIRVFSMIPTTDRITKNQAKKRIVAKAPIVMYGYLTTNLIPYY